MKCTGCVKDENGQIVEVLCTYDPTAGAAIPPTQGQGRHAALGGRGNCVDAEVRLYDNLFSIWPDGRTRLVLASSFRGPVLASGSIAILYGWRKRPRQGSAPTGGRRQHLVLRVRPRLYLQLNTAGMGKRQNSAPKSVPDAELEFGNGCILRLWEQGRLGRVQPRMGPRRVRLVPGADGTNYMYDTDQVRWQVLGKWVPGE